MAKKKAKWLEGSTLSIVEAIVASLSAEEVTEALISKALKGAEEIKERAAIDEAEPTVQGLLAKVSGALVSANELIDQAGALYKSDIEAAGELDSDDEEDSEDEDEKEIEAAPKNKKSKKADKAEKAADVDYESMSKKDLKIAAKEAGIKVTKKMGKDEIIEALNSAK